jgi:phosphoribosylformylglycinamidine synthase
VSGKDSLSSTYTHGDTVINIPPVLTITVFGRIPDVEKTVSQDIKKSGSALVLVGRADTEHLGGSVYFQNADLLNSHVSEVDMDGLPAVLDSMRDAIQTGAVLSCKAVGEGGLATTLAHMCFGGDCGADVDLQPMNAARADFALFGETAGTFVVEVNDQETANRLFRNVPHIVLGHTTAEKSIRVRDGGGELFTAATEELKPAWQTPIAEVLV